MVGVVVEVELMVEVELVVEVELGVKGEVVRVVVEDATVPVEEVCSTVCSALSRLLTELGVLLSMKIL